MKPFEPERGAADRRIWRQEQFTAIATRAPVSALCSLGCLATLVGMFWNSASHGLLVGLFSILACLHIAAISRSRAWLSGSRDRLSDAQLWLWVLIAIPIAMTWSVLLMALFDHATPDQRQLIVSVFPGLITSGLLTAPLLPAALAMIVIPTGAVIAVTQFLSPTPSPAYAVIIVVYAAAIFVSTVELNRDFKRRVENQATVRRQAETIGLLLEDFEESGSNWLWETDDALRLINAPKRLCTILDRFPDTLNGLLLADVIDKRETGMLNVVLQHFANRTAFRDIRIPICLDGRRYWFLLSGRPRFDVDGLFLGYGGIGSDVTDLHVSNDRIAYLVRYDDLTGLPNRTLFNEALQEATTGSDDFMLLCLDLDGFKTINDTYGHNVGDELLVAVGARVRNCVRAGDVVARLGGDEFAILQHTDKQDDAASLARRLTDTLSQPFDIGGISALVTASIGIAPKQAGDDSPTKTLVAAELALHESKTDGKATWRFFEPSMATLAQQRHGMQMALRNAIESGALDLAFQPILDVQSDVVTCVETLVRWKDPILGQVSPAQFIPIAEETGLIVPLGAWVLRRACIEAVRWPGTVRVAVNLSAVQMRDPDLLATIDTALHIAGLSPNRLEIEITESVFLNDAAATIECLRALRSRGISISLDDFGTGYSSLSYLRSFPFDKVKIDQSFMRDLQDSPDSLSIVRAIVGMATSLGMKTTGEGVETVEQAEILSRTGCDQLQGYLFGRPCNSDQIVRSIGECTQRKAPA